MANIRETIKSLAHFDLDGAIKETQQLLAIDPSLQGRDELTTIANDYTLMKQFMRQGMKDPKRNDLFYSLMQRLYKVIAEIELNQLCHTAEIYIKAFSTSKGQNTSHDFIRSVLENFVSEIAMLSLQNETTQQAESQAMYERHYLFMDKLFCHILVSSLWSEDDAAFYASLLTNPIIDQNDQLLIISAISLSVMNVYDPQKANTLFSVYTSANETAVAQRAFVGWTLSFSEIYKIYPEQVQAFAEALQNEKIRTELFDLQLQMFSCMNAEKDNDKIQSDIMPDILSNSNFHMGRFGGIQTEKDELENILNPNLDEERMEKVEQSVQRMMQMQKAGSDIYFGGFKQMKRFGFFARISNWFTPFSLHHPDLHVVSEKLRNSPFVKLLSKQKTFCDSDKYSLFLAMSQVFERLPNEMQEMLNTDPSASMMGIPAEIDEPVVYSRRMYLQDFYRFFRIQQSNRTELRNPFFATTSTDTFFFLSSVFHKDELRKEQIRLAKYLYKHHQFMEMNLLLENIAPNDADTYILKAYGALFHKDFSLAKRLFDEALIRDANSLWALNGQANAALECNDYEAAEQAYKQLVALEPTKQTYQLNHAATLIRLGRATETLNILYKLNFENPSSKRIKRTLAWALLCDDQTEKARKLYEELLADNPSAVDCLNAGYAFWFSGDIAQTYLTFQRWQSYDPTKSLRNELKKDAYFLEQKGMSEIDLQLIIGMIEEP